MFWSGRLLLGASLVCLLAALTPPTLGGDLIEELKAEQNKTQGQKKLVGKMIRALIRHKNSLQNLIETMTSKDEIQLEKDRNDLFKELHRVQGSRLYFVKMSIDFKLKIDYLGYMIFVLEKEANLTDTVIKLPDVMNSELLDPLAVLAEQSGLHKRLGLKGAKQFDTLMKLLDMHDQQPGKINKEIQGLQQRLRLEEMVELGSKLKNEIGVKGMADIRKALTIDMFYDLDSFF
ncbi:hypothetical protein ElyMa_000162100 [Elysia marginata]|uniref:Uncharacterized protein n=1 Tax=Elysia marginata TaxID=1093978 RepID=A0AAV4ES75_9GAST|nr:hypothetical protein ElyMa_000162100 [Elysia marginata]